MVASEDDKQWIQRQMEDGTNLKHQCNDEIGTNDNRYEPPNYEICLRPSDKKNTSRDPHSYSLLFDLAAFICQQ